MEHFPLYSNLEGLKAINITKKTDKGNFPIPIEIGGEVRDYLENGNILYCDLKTDEYWINTSLNMRSNQKKLSISLDIKNRLEMPLKKLKMLLIKTGLNFWIDFCKNDDFHYIFYGAKCKTLKAKQILEFEIDDLVETTQIDELCVKDVFEFNSEIICNLNLISIEELIFLELKKYKSEDFANKFKFEDLYQVNFEEFISSKKFEDELITIKKLIKKSLKIQLSDSKGKCLAFNRAAASLSNLPESLANSTELGYFMSLIIMPTIDKKLKKLNLNDDKNNNENSNNNQSKVIVDFKNYIKSSEDDKNNNININKSSEENNNEKNESSEEIKKVFESKGLTINNLNSEKIEKKGNDTEDNFKCLVNEKNDRTIHLENEIHPENNRKSFLNSNKILYFSDDNKEDDNNKFNKTEKQPANDTVINSEQSKKQRKKSAILQNIRIQSNKSLTLCNEILTIITLDKINSILDSTNKIKLIKLSLEKISMPQFRNFKLNTEFKEEKISKSETNSQSLNQPVINNNRKIIMFISGLILVFIIIIIVVLIY